MNKSSCTLFALIITAAVHADAEPLVKNGNCPMGYWERGSYCIPLNDTHAAAGPVVKNGDCPMGYWTRGGYCIPLNDNVNPVIPKVGDCPMGYFWKNNYCVKR